ncbi:MAG: hypothetical protein ACK559_02225 [bacterium]
MRIPYYEVQWEGYPESENTWQRANEFKRTSTIRKWMKLADKGRPAARQSSMNRDQCNAIYAVLWIAFWLTARHYAGGT